MIYGILRQREKTQEDILGSFPVSWGRPCVECFVGLFGSASVIYSFFPFLKSSGISILLGFRGRCCLSFFFLHFVSLLFLYLLSFSFSHVVSSILPSSSLSPSLMLFLLSSLPLLFLLLSCRFFYPLSFFPYISFSHIFSSSPSPFLPLPSPHARTLVKSGLICHQVPRYTLWHQRSGTQRKARGRGGGGGDKVSLLEWNGVRG